MKPKSIKSLLALALLAPGVLFAQTTAKTTPVGYSTLALGGIPSGGDAFLSVPLDRGTASAGSIASITGDNEINIQGAPGYTAAQWTATPHIIKVTSGSKNGFYALITANDSDTLTVNLPTGQTLAGVTAGDKVEVQQAWTASSFLGSAIPADTELYQYSGITPGTNVAADFLYIYDGSSWLDGVSGEPVDPVMYPGEAFVLRNVSASAIPAIVVSGQVPVSKYTNIITNYGDGQQDLPFGIVSPIDQTLAESGLTAIAAADDEVNFYDNAATGVNKAPFSSIVFDGTDWLDAVSGEPVSADFKIKAGEGFVYRRAAGSPTVNWSISPSYIPSL
jgi:uncharacterized protein (TIGR02597 family)